MKRQRQKQNHTKPKTIIDTIRLRQDFNSIFKQLHNTMDIAWAAIDQQGQEIYKLYDEDSKTSEIKNLRAQIDNLNVRIKELEQMPLPADKVTIGEIQALRQTNQSLVRQMNQEAEYQRERHKEASSLKARVEELEQDKEELYNSVNRLKRLLKQKNTRLKNMNSK